MRNFADLSPEEMRIYLQLVGEATRQIVPPDANYLVVLFGHNGEIHFIYDGDTDITADGLRSLAEDIEDADHDIESNGRG